MHLCISIYPTREPYLGVSGDFSYGHVRIQEERTRRTAQSHHETSADFDHHRF